MKLLVGLLAGTVPAFLAMLIALNASAIFDTEWTHICSSLLVGPGKG